MFALAALALVLSTGSIAAFHVGPKGATTTRRRLRAPRVWSAPAGLALPLDAEWVGRGTALDAVFEACQVATVPAPLDSGEGSHDSSRWEWGTWVNLESLEELMVAVDTVVAAPGAWGTLSSAVEAAVAEAETFAAASGVPLLAEGDGALFTGGALRVQVAGGENWHVALISLPPGASCQARWPTGSFTVLKPLTGMVEAALVRGSTRLQAKSLRGGGDGSLGGGGSGGGDECVKFLGGPLRGLVAQGHHPALLLEVAVRPPTGATDGAPRLPRLPFAAAAAAAFATLQAPPPPPEGPSAASSEETSLPLSRSSVGAARPASEPKSAAAVVPATERAGGGGLRDKLSLGFEQVGGLDGQLDGLVRRVLASRANPAAAKRLGVSHVRGVLVSGPPGCGKTLLARELARCLGAREPQIVNGPEILDKFVGEAEKKVRSLFYPAEAEYAEVGDASALHVIIFDEMDAVARRRGSLSGDTTGVRDSVVNQLLAKMDGVVEASNVLVVGLTNRPELLDEALLRPGRLEVHLKVALPDAQGRAQILNIHTRRMRANGALSAEALALLDPQEGEGFGVLAEATELFSGAEIAGLVRSAASFALARTVVDGGDGVVTAADLQQALRECQPALKRDESLLAQRFPGGIAEDLSPDFSRLIRDLARFTAKPQPTGGSPSLSSSSGAGRVRSALLVGGGDGSGVTALAAYAAHTAVARGGVGVVRFVDALDLLAAAGDGSEGARAAALVEQFSAAKAFDGCALLVLDDVDQIVAGSGSGSSGGSGSPAAGSYSPLLLATLRALLRQPPAPQTASAADSASGGAASAAGPRSLLVLATTSRRAEACGGALKGLFEEALFVPLLAGDATAVGRLLNACGPPGLAPAAVPGCAALLAAAGTSQGVNSSYLPPVGVKAALRFAERAVAAAGLSATAARQEAALAELLEDAAAGSALAGAQCDV